MATTLDWLDAAPTLFFVVFLVASAALWLLFALVARIVLGGPLLWGRLLIFIDHRSPFVHVQWGRRLK